MAKGARIVSATLESFGSDRFSNRELSRLEFGSRLLDLAEDRALPLLERCKFVAIFSEMIDEFYQVRVVSLEDKIAAGVDTRSLDGLRPRQQLRNIRERVLSLIDRQDRLVLDSLRPELAEAGVQIVAYEETTGDEKVELREFFEENVYPILTPLSVDPGHPFPMISNLSLNIAAVVRDEETGEERIARVKVPPSLPRFCSMSNGSRWCLLEDLIIAHLDRLFPGMTLGRADMFRVTRNADLALEEDEADDLMVALEMELRRRRFGRALRLEIQQGMPDDLRRLLVEQLDLDESKVYVSDAPLGLSNLWALYSLDRPDLKSESWSPTTPPRLVGEDGVSDIFAAMRDGDILLHHPYDSFSDSVEAFISQAANDPDVVAIKQTLYRTSGDSPIVASLIRAAERGKQVAALVEIKARFDEAANIEWAKALEDAGVHVVYGVIGLKTHSKTALVIRHEGDTTRRYVHIGTGNYNDKTARTYEDFGILTCDDEITRDVGDLFNFLTGFAKQGHYRKLIVSPLDTRRRIIELIEREAAKGSQGRIDIKVNGLTDPAIIDALYGASQAGASVRLAVRTLCCLRPGVAGLSENITVKSVVGEFLEHSRVFIFGAWSSDDVRVFIGSADLMERNLDRRVEVLVPIESERLRSSLYESITLTFQDDLFSWSLGTDRRWRRVSSVNELSVQAELKTRTLERSRTLVH
jgi:polyphosphate kinase